MAILSNFQRAQATRTWIREGRPGSREDFIKKLCEEKGIKYRPNVVVKPQNVKRLPKKQAQDPSAEMFPQK